MNATRRDRKAIMAKRNIASTLELNNMDSRLDSVLTTILNSPLDTLKHTYETSIPSELAPPPSFWESYPAEKLVIGLRACLAIWAASGNKIVPKDFQIMATMALMSGQDALIDVGTGYGKTLCMIIPCLLDAPGSTSIVISPLKRLQAVQVLEFQRYGITTVAINEDTPNDPELWKNIREGKFSVLLVQPEQLSMIAGHLPRLARLIEQDRHFRKQIVRVHVDEAHSIFTAGIELYGIPAFRPAWGRLGEFRIKLGKGVVFQALSGTQPAHIKKTIIHHLLFDEKNLCSIKLSSNRPNMAYTTHPIVGSLSDFRNLDFIVPDPYPDGDFRLPKTLVFHDNLEECTAAAVYLNERLPKQLRSKGLVQHYHGGMSKGYLTLVYDDFKKEDGACRILHATEGASTGLDIPNIEVVVQYGITRNVPTTLQRGGRGGRTSSGQAIFLIMYEPWVMKIDLSAVKFDIPDPDHPTVEKLIKNSTKQERTGIAMIKIVQSEADCIRKMYANYLGDKSLDALQFTTPWCCSRHGSPVSFDKFFKGRFLYQDIHTGDLYYGTPGDPSNRIDILPPQKEKRKAQSKRRSPDERKSLVSRLFAWRYNSHAMDPLAAVRPPSFIIDDTDIALLAKLHPEDITDYHQIRDTLDHTKEWEDEWSQKIFDVIQQFNQDLITLRQTTTTQKKNHQKRMKIAQDITSFEQDSKENEERIRLQVLQRFTQQRSSNNVQILQSSTIDNQ